jgi:MarR family transcriptional regulator, organic hydroperoxide resistance regulator
MRAYTSVDESDFIHAEQDVRSRVGDLDLDYAALAAISNIFRAANAVRNHMERNVLRDVDLSWSSFVTLFVLWIWGEMETGRLAEECAVSKGTLTGVLSTLEKRKLAARKPHQSDGRRVLVRLTPGGKRLITKIFPAFNQHEAKATERLTDKETRQLAHLLREIVRGTKDADS